MSTAFRVWIHVERVDRFDLVPVEGESADDVPLDFGPSATFVARDDTDVSVSRARDRAEGFAEQLHETAAGMRP